MRSAQYVRVGGRDEVYLLPRFVGREWESVAISSPAPATSGSGERDARGAASAAAPAGASR